MTGNSIARDGSDRRGIMIFGLLILVFLILSMAAYMISGHMGIEDRWKGAAGIEGEPGEAGNSGFYGFSIEGNPLQYLIVSLVLGAVCVALYFKFRI